MATYEDPISQNIEGVRQLVESRLNKTEGAPAQSEEGQAGWPEDELTLKLDDAELLALSNTWESNYAPYASRVQKRQKLNKAFYLGQQGLGSPQALDEDQVIAANLIFEAVETFLPAALSKNPEPVVFADNTPEGNEVSGSVKTMLQFHADKLTLRRKLSLVTRNWLLDLLGVMKHGWDDEIQDITSEIRDVKNFIFDPNTPIDADGDYNGPLGERITCSASKVIDLFPKHKDFILVVAKGKLGTEITYTEWWNDDYCFYTLKGVVLDKHKNPFYVYDKSEDREAEDGTIERFEFKGKNHFAKPKKPYTFLSVYTLGQQPHDVTSLIEQNIPNQKRITKRTQQLDYNLSRANNSDVFSENAWNQQTAKQAAQAMAKGHPVLAPAGAPISESIARLAAQSVPDSFFNELEVSKNDLRSIFGTQGITATQQDEDQTARGMILNQQYDNSRIGGGIGDALEQFAKNVFNWWVQLYYVYYDDRHFASIMGQMKAVEYVELSRLDLDRQLSVSVAPDSMKPHDEITEMNQAMALWEAGAIDPKSLLTILNFPDPQQTAGQAVLWKINPQMYMQLNFPEMLQELQQAAQPAQAPTAAPGGPVPESVTPQTPQSLGGVPANPSLSSVPINSSALPQ